MNRSTSQNESGENTTLSPTEIACKTARMITTVPNVVVPSIYLVICIIGLIGNAFVIGILVKQDRKSVYRNKRSVTNILVINLAIADFIFVGALPFWATELFLGGHWIFGIVGCKLLSFMSLLNLYGSVFFLVAMGIDRYLAVVFAVRARNYRTPRNAVRVCIGVWIFASVIASQGLVFRWVSTCPALIRILAYSQTSEICSNLIKCSWFFPAEKKFMDAYFVIRTSLGFFLPFLIIVYCYIFIIVSMKRRSRNVSSSATRITSKQQKVTSLILCVISLFVICWLPNHIVTLMVAINIHDPKATNDLQLDTASRISSCLAYANSSLNPIVYAFMKEDVRIQGINLVRRCLGMSVDDDHRVVIAAPSRPQADEFALHKRNAKLASLYRTKKSDRVDLQLESNNDGHLADTATKCTNNLSLSGGSSPTDYRLSTNTLAVETVAVCSGVSEGASLI